MRDVRCGILTFLFVTLFVISLPNSHIDGREKFPSYLTPQEAGPDFQIQGEYVGKVGNSRTIAAQVIALGEGKFQGVLYLDGLPGAGWDERTMFHCAGERDGEQAQFHGIFGERIKFRDESFKGAISGGLFVGEAQMFLNVVKSPHFRLNKVHRQSPTLGAKPPPGAIVLFDGGHVDEWIDGKLEKGNLLGVGTDSKRKFRSVYIHMEFRCPFMPTARGMQRGNSGIYVKREWEVQILDSFGWNAENRKYERLSIFGRCGGIHEMIKPRLNMSFPPLSWQTYDIDFVAARFDDSSKKVAPAMMSVRHNGVLIHDRFVLPETPPGERPNNEKAAGPIFLQNHGNPVRFRNIWVIEK